MEKNITAEGIGHGFLKSYGSFKETHKLLVKNVLYIPELEGNLSVKHLTSNDLTVKFQRIQCELKKGK